MKPTPWLVVPFGDEVFEVVAADGTLLATFSRALDGDSAADTAYLMAAAPDLRRMLIVSHGCATVREDGTCGGCSVSDVLRLSRPPSHAAGKKL